MAEFMLPDVEKIEYLRWTRAGAEGECNHRSQGAIRARPVWQNGQETKKYYFLQMSSLWKQPCYGPKGLENCWHNQIFGAHDCICGCNDTTLHLLQVLSKNNPKKPTLKQLKEIKCLLTGEEDTTEETDGVDGLKPGDLDILFAEEEEDVTAVDDTG